MLPILKQFLKVFWRLNSESLKQYLVESWTCKVNPSLRLQQWVTNKDKNVLIAQLSPLLSSYLPLWCINLSSFWNFLNTCYTKT